MGERIPSPFEEVVWSSRLSQPLFSQILQCQSSAWTYSRGKPVDPDVEERFG